jgi:hypothetical protein
MSLYREAGAGRRRRRIVLAAAGAALAAIAIVLAVALTGDRSAEERLRDTQDEVQPALAALELIPIHYESPVASTHAAAAEQLDVARRTVEDAEEDLRALDANGTEALVADIDALDELVRTTGRSAAVEQASARAARELRRLVRLPA